MFCTAALNATNSGQSTGSKNQIISFLGKEELDGMKKCISCQTYTYHPSTNCIATYSVHQQQATYAHVHISSKHFSFVLLDHPFVLTESTCLLCFQLLLITFVFYLCFNKTLIYSISFTTPQGSACGSGLWNSKNIFRITKNFLKKFAWVPFVKRKRRKKLFAYETCLFYVFSCAFTKREYISLVSFANILSVILDMLPRIKKYDFRLSNI